MRKYIITANDSEGIGKATALQLNYSSQSNLC